MQSCPYEKSVLRKKLFFVELAAVNTKKIRVLYNGSLIKSESNVHESICQCRETEVTKVVIFYCKHSNIPTRPWLIIKFQLFVIFHIKFVKYCVYRYGMPNLLVLLLLLLCYIGRILGYKTDVKLNAYERTAKKFHIDQDLLLHVQNVKDSVVTQVWLQIFLLSCCACVYYKYHIERVQTGLKISKNLNGSYIDSDMEVDEKSIELKENINNQTIKEESLNYHFELGKSKDPNLPVINSVQHMKENECAQVNNSFNCVRYDDNTDAKLVVNNEMVANGDLVNCIGNNTSEPSKLNPINNISCTVIENAILCSKIKNEDVSSCSKLNGTDSFNGNKIKENELIIEESNKIFQDEKSLNNCNIKSSDSNSEKDRTKAKDHVRSNNVGSHSTLSAPKKTDDISSSYHSSSSSSSSRSKYKDYKSSSHKTSSSSKNNERRKSSDREKSRHESSDKKKSRSCHHKPDEKCHCKSHHHSRHHSKSKKFQSVKTQCTPDEIAYELRLNKTEISNPYFTRVPWVPHSQLTNLKYGRYYRIETDRNGGATTVHLYMDEISHLTESQMKECAIEFIKLSYSEDDNECAYHVMGIVHGAAAYLPDLVDYMADHYPTLTVKTGSLASRDNHTTTMSQYRDEVYKTYSNGTFRYAPLDQLSICGVLGEEVGAYFPDFVARLEQSPFMKPVMPWSSLSVVETDNPRESNDGPIFWVRPGEQMLPANEALKESARPKKRRNNELDNLAYIAGSRSSEARESLFQDRTKAHADQVGVDYGLSNTAPTAAVGVLKSVNCGHPEHGNRATKDVVAFHAQDYNELLEILMLDLYEPPQTQCTKWIEVSKLNTLRREGIRYAHVQLHDNDVYYLPRKIIHQFQTISSVASVAWHIRYKDYFSIMGAPNLHTPTGINKGQVFYEKKNIAVYYPPVCENELLASVTTPVSPISKTPKKYEKFKDYSPFKHSPRKNHKIHSPRVSSKKEKGSDLVPNTPEKKDSESTSNQDEKKTGKKDYNKCNEHDESTPKKERESASNKSCDLNHSSNHSSVKKERKEGHESSSGHQKEVRNLESDFDLKKIKNKSTKSPSKSRCEKSERESSGRRKSDESRSKYKRHEDSKSKSHKHDKSSSHRKSDSCAISNGHVVKSEDNKHEKNAALKRKSSDSQDSCSSKRIKEDSVEKCGNLIENMKNEESNVFDEKSVSESEISNFNICEVDVDSGVKGKNNFMCNDSSKVEENDGEIDDGDNDNETKSFNCEIKTVDVTNEVKMTDLEKTEVKLETELDDDVTDKVSSCERLSSDLNPPLPCNSPPSNPPLPPNSPGLSDSVAETFRASEAQTKEESSCPSSSPVSNTVAEESANGTHHMQSLLSKDNKNYDILSQGKKFKKKMLKKVVKEENESYDLLGDIMSQMDKKK